MVYINRLSPEDQSMYKEVYGLPYDREICLEQGDAADEFAILKQSALARCEYRTKRGNEPFPFDAKITSSPDTTSKLLANSEMIAGYAQLLNEVSEVTFPLEDVTVASCIFDIRNYAPKLAEDITISQEATEESSGWNFDSGQLFDF